MKAIRFSCRQVLGLLACATIATSPLAGQGRIAIVAGVTSSNWTLSPGCRDCQESLTGIAGGVSFDVALGKELAFVPELLYVKKGAAVEFGGNAWIDFRLHYVEVPLLFRYSPRASQSVHPFFYVGPEVAISTACSAKATNSPSNGGTLIIDPCTTGEGSIREDQPDPLDFGLIVGAGVAFGRFSTSVRYDHGLSDIYSRYTGTGTTRNRAWLVMISAAL